MLWWGSTMLLQRCFNGDHGLALLQVRTVLYRVGFLFALIGLLSSFHYGLPAWTTSSLAGFGVALVLYDFWLLNQLLPVSRPNEEEDHAGRP